MEPSELHTLVKGRYSQTQDDEGDMGQEILLRPGKAPTLRDDDNTLPCLQPPHSAVLVFWLSLETGGKLSEWRGLAIFMFVPVALIPMPGKCMLPEFAE